MTQAQQVAWDDVKLFLSLLRTRRLAATARALGFDISTASRRLARLEARLKVSLFDRRREGISPTAAGLRLRSFAEEMERAAHGFSREVDGLEREVEGAVKLSVPPGVAESFIAPVLHELSRRHPRLRFEVDASTRQADLTRREADLAIRTVKPTGGPLVRQLLVRAKWVPLAAPELVASLGRLRSWDDVPWVGFGFELERLHVARWLQAHTTTAPLLRTNSFAMQVAAVQRGLGAAMMPEPYLNVHHLAPLQLSRGLAAQVKTAPVDPLWLVTHEALRRVPRVAAVWEFLVGAFGA